LQISTTVQSLATLASVAAFLRNNRGRITVGEFSV